MRIFTNFTKSAVLFVPLALGACDPGPASGNDEAPLSDYDALFEGVPSNDELPVELKADGEPPLQWEVDASLISPVKSQGSRGVCSIFSTVGLMEHLYLVAGMDEPDFSEQYLQWSAKFEVGSFPNSSGSNAHYNLQAINRFGIPVEEAWPYESAPWNTFDDPECDGEDDQPTRCHTNGEPPESARTAAKFHLPRGRWINSSAASIKDHMRVTGTGVVVGLDFFYQSWNHRLSVLPRNMEFWNDGYVTYPNDEDIEKSHEQRAGHSILLVGWDDELEVPMRDAEGEFLRDADGNVRMEKGFFIFKNSWGTDGFGLDHPNGRGYGYISMRYVERWGSARVSDVPDFTPEPGDDGGMDDGEPVDGDTFESTDVLEIPDNDPTGIASVIDVPAGDSNRVRVDVDIRHTWRGDLTVRLRHGDRVVALHEGSGGGQDDLQLSVTLDDFAGVDRAGGWTLEVVDNARADTGSLQSWSLTFE